MRKIKSAYIPDYLMTRIIIGEKIKENYYDNEYSFLLDDEEKEDFIKELENLINILQ